MPVSEESYLETVIQNKARDKNFPSSLWLYQYESSDKVYVNKHLEI